MTGDLEVYWFLLLLTVSLTRDKGRHFMLSQDALSGRTRDKGGGEGSHVDPKSTGTRFWNWGPAASGPIHTGRGTRRARKLECFSFDVACVQCRHPHLHQEVPFARVALHVASRVLCGLGLKAKGLGPVEALGFGVPSKMRPWDSGTGSVLLYMFLVSSSRREQEVRFCRSPNRGRSSVQDFYRGLVKLCFRVYWVSTVFTFHDIFWHFHFFSGTCFAEANQEDFHHCGTCLIQISLFRNPPHKSKTKLQKFMFSIMQRSFLHIRIWKKSLGKNMFELSGGACTSLLFHLQAGKLPDRTIALLWTEAVLCMTKDTILIRRSHRLCFFQGMLAQDQQTHEANTMILKTEKRFNIRISFQEWHWYWMNCKTNLTRPRAKVGKICDLGDSVGNDFWPIRKEKPHFHFLPCIQPTNQAVLPVPWTSSPEVC